MNKGRTLTHVLMTALLLVGVARTSDSQLNISGGAPAFPILSPDGTCSSANVPYSFLADQGTGFRRAGSGSTQYCSGGGGVFTMNGSGLTGGNGTHTNFPVIQDGSANVAISFTAPTVASGFGSGASFDTNASAASFVLNIGTTPGTSGVIGLPTVSDAWVCQVDNITSAARGATVTAYGTTSVTISDITAWSNNDKIAGSCVGH